jgi:pimeloyl-ACP methyl ester carboxylesterase
MQGRYRVDALLSARHYLNPKLVDGRIYFLSDMSGRISLYVMDRGGSVPEPLLPPHIALQNPHHMVGEAFYVLPDMNRILVMIDKDGDENYQPNWIPLDGGFPERIFGERFEGQQLFCSKADRDQGVAVFDVDPRTEAVHNTFKMDLETGDLTDLGSSKYGNSFACANKDYSRIVLADMYSFGDITLYLWDETVGERTLLFGTPLEHRVEGQTVAPNGIQSCEFAADDQGLLLVTSLFDDNYGLAYLPLADPQAIRPVEIRGVVHEGVGELESLDHLVGERYRLVYNIDGSSYAYEGEFDAQALCFNVSGTLCGLGVLSEGVLESIAYEKESDNYSLSFSTATSPSQIYTIEGEERQVVQHTRQRILGIPQGLLSAGEEASYTSHDGLRVSARLYLPSPELGFAGRRPVIFYIHGGPQSQERPDFTWFSMPLIQFFTLNGFAVWAPNARGSTGYGLDYMKRVDHDWGGQDRLDHVEAHRQLQADPRLDMTRVGVMGRSYGGYMTLTLAGRHPELWQAACDMFGPYNLFTFMDRLPETWKTYFYHAVGHPVEDKEFLVERSPSTHLHQLRCPLLVIQGQNDPRVVEEESRSLVEALRAQGKEVEYIVFHDEGHDVLKYENRVRCYNAITSFFASHLQP